MESRNSFGRGPLMRWMVFLVVAAMLLGAVLIPISVALGEESPAANLHAEVTHLVLSQKGTSLGVFQMLQMVNDTSKDSGPITVALPEGAIKLEVVAGLAPEQMGEAKGGFVDKVGIPAGGKKQLAFRYQLPAASSALTLRLTFPFPTALVYILTDPATMTMPATLNTPFEDGGSLDMGGRVLRQYVRGEIKAGETLQVNLQLTPDQDALAEAAKAAAAPAAPAAGTTSTAPAAKNSNTANVIVLGATAALALAALALAWRRFGGRSPAAATAGPAPAAPRRAAPGGSPDGEAGLLRRKNELVSQIARLDQSHARGELGENEHARQRQTFKQQLMDVLLQLKQIQG